jgi:hypothetical protein
MVAQEGAQTRAQQDAFKWGIDNGIGWEHRQGHKGRKRWKGGGTRIGKFYPIRRRTFNETSEKPPPKKIRNKHLYFIDSVCYKTMLIQ